MSAPTRAGVPAGVPAGASAGTEADELIRAAAARVIAAGPSRPRPGPYPVNQPMIDHWLTALESYRYGSGEAGPGTEAGGAIGAGDEVQVPPSMIQVWTMPGLGGRRPADDPLAAMMQVLDQAGFTAVVATNCEQTYHRYLRVGERVSVSARLESVIGPKRTALGEGWFVTTHNTWFVDGEPVAEMLFRVLKFRPPSAERAASTAPATAASTATSAPATLLAPSPAGGPLRPVVSRDTEFFWAGTAVRELRIQRCSDCGAVRHPPGPRCPACGSQRRGYLLAAGTGTIFSYVVHHHPPVSGRTAPFVVALVELPEGVRMLGELVGVDPGDPGAASAIRIGAPVRVSWQAVDDSLTLPAWHLEQPR